MKKRMILTLLGLVMLTGACTIDPPLHLRKTAETAVVLVPTITTTFMWQVNWQTEWQFNWSVDALGPLEYVVPNSVRMHDYTLDPDYQPKSHTVYNFNGTNGQVQLFQGVHNLLFHNVGSEVNLFRAENDLADVHAYMFERFYRADEARSFEGTGLGLSIAKWIVDKHKGHFEILSRPDIGTRIRIVL